MGWISVILVLALFFLLFKNIKHIIFRKSLKFISIILLLFIVLTVVAYYVDWENYFSGDNMVEKTGASITNIIKNNDLINKKNMGEFGEKILNKVKNLDLPEKFINE